MIANTLRNSSLAAIAAATLGLAALSLSGCSLQTTAAPTATLLPSMHGTVMGGDTPIAGSSLILWETDPANGGYGSTGAVKLATATGSTPGGNFSFTGAYTCTPGEFVYLTSTGGDVSDGSAIPVINNNVVLMAALGSCSNLTTTTQRNATHVIINELSTVAAAYTLGAFMNVDDTTPGAQLVYIGATGNNNGGTGICTGTGSTMACQSAGLAHAFANAANLVDAVHFDGSFPSGAANATVPGNSLGSVPQAEVNALGDILQYCTNSAGGVAGDTSACGNLFTDATPPGHKAPAETLQAALDIAHFPRNNVGSGVCTGTTGGLFCLIPATPAFAPVLSTAPHDWDLAIAYSGTSLGSFGVPQYLTLDPDDNVYVMTSDNFTPTEMGMAAMSSSGAGLWANALDPNNCIPGTLATDTAGNVWETDSGTSTSKCNGNTGIYAIYGYAESTGALTYTLGPSATDPTHAIQSTPNAVAFDRLNNLWYDRKSSSCTNCLFELPYTAPAAPATTATYGAPTNIQNAMIDLSQIMIDRNYNLWIGNVVTGSTLGTLYVVPNQTPTTVDSPTYTATSGFLSAALPATDDGGIALDAAGNIWTGSTDNVSEFTPTTSSGVVTGFGTATNTASLASKPYPGEVDGNGLFWYGSYTSSGDIYYQITPSSPFYSATPANDTDDILPCYVPNGTTTCNATIATPATVVSASPRVMQVDSAGALWVAAPGVSGSTTGYVLQILGQASPTWPQLSYGVFGTKPQ